jgi:S-adenosylmethionine synthetase
VRELPQVGACECRLVSRTGHPIDDPQIADLRVRLRTESAAVPANGIEQIVRLHLSSLGSLAEALGTGAIVLSTWPLRRAPTSSAA